MPKKPTFQLRRRDGVAEEMPYTPLIVTSGTVTHKLALHRDPIGNWVVSHPESGAAIIRQIVGWYKGCPVSTKAFSLQEARQLAMADVEELIQRIGVERFNTVLANPKPF